MNIIKYIFDYICIFGKSNHGYNIYIISPLYMAVQNGFFNNNEIKVWIHRKRRAEYKEHPPATVDGDQSAEDAHEHVTGERNESIPVSNYWPSLTGTRSVQRSEGQQCHKEKGMGEDGLN